jgi:hypothetical protein
MASTKRSSLLDRFKGKQIDIRTTAGAHVIGTLDDADNDFLLISPVVKTKRGSS